MAHAELSVGEVAARSGVAVSAVHFYERLGLITSRRTGGNQRRFDRDVLRRLAVIRAAQELGIPLKQVQDAFRKLPDMRAPGRDDWEAISSGWRDMLEARISKLERLRDRLGECIGCGCLSMDRCSIFNDEDKAACDGVGAVFLER
ncbi:redox-sensitive transcriptional activator SoxR [Oryzibacter oryziterrae]|uniref:redox-sensitive transcriptional activator SoxR n=1 Tax=Oryzibacter oryziterrae TaxID=2766474 RepID=UPI001F025687|nr:redox-sensitive transcriptional activator SoxR [Oryzibacter oryziterrae]